MSLTRSYFNKNQSKNEKKKTKLNIKTKEICVFPILYENKMIEFDVGMKIGITLSMIVISLEASILGSNWGFLDWFINDYIKKIKVKWRSFK